jgi:hypothetical protein
VLALMWVGSPLLLLIMLWLARWVGRAMMVQHSVPQRGTSGRSFHSLPLLGFFVGADHIICDDDNAKK